MNVEVLPMLVLIVLLWSKVHHWTNRAIRAEAALAKIEATVSECDRALSPSSTKCDAAHQC